MRAYLRRLLRATRDAMVGPSDDGSIIGQLVRRDRRWETFVGAIEYANYEQVPGDVMEFGVFAGTSLALLAKALSFDEAGRARRLVGFDSFEGLPSSVEDHARWRAGACATNQAWHPLLPVGGRVTPQVTRDLFSACGLPQPILEVGPFEHTLPKVIPSQYPCLAVLHVDCDLYESTRVVLDGVAPALQDGTLVLFDDWFHYKGDPHKGEARAFAEFLQHHPEWEAVHYRAYSVFCNSFILHRR
jgi:hypothetical protein